MRQIALRNSIFEKRICQIEIGMMWITVIHIGASLDNFQAEVQI